MAETSDLKSLQYEFESHHAYAAFGRHFYF